MPVARRRLPVACCLFLGAVLASPPARSQVTVRVTVTPARPYLVLGTDTQIDVGVEVTGDGAEAYAPARVFATVGTLQPPERGAAPGKFVARYLPPPDRFPQVALLVVELAAGGERVRGAARLPLHGLTEVPLRSSPGASVTVRVLDRAFGPVAADRQGHVKVPVEVPPGVRTGLARAVDHNGSVRETEIDLQPEPFRRVLVVAPASMEVGSFAEVSVLAVEPSGEPVPAPRLALRASDGLAHPLGAGGLGEARFLVEAPRRLGGGTMALTAVAAGTPPSRADLAVSLYAGGPRTLTLSPSSRRLVIGSGESARVVISARDQFGNPTSAGGAVVLVDGRPAPIELSPSGQGALVVMAPARRGAADRITVEASLRAARAAQEIRLTGGPPAGLTLELADARIVADGRRSTELRVRAVDRNGTPTMIPGLSWVTPGGRIRRVRMPREGEYVAEFVPEAAQDPHREVLSVMASQELRAGAVLEVTPPQSHLLAAARVGLFSNLARTAGPAGFLEALTPLRLRAVRLAAGLTAGYLHGDLTTTASGASGDIAARLVVDQVPLLAVLRWRVAALRRPELSVDAGAGVSFAHTRLTAMPGSDALTVEAGARAAALQGGAELAFPIAAGRLVVGMRYLWIALGRTTHGDEIRGNSAGLLGDLGYRLSW